ncbi:MAG: SDR family NAD(P)-dependent oxidoreductase [Pseudomonadota bacterium]
MIKTILITGSTDGIGLETAKLLVSKGHRVLLHGRNPAKLKATQESLSASPESDTVEAYTADHSRIADVETLAKAVTAKHAKLDVLINNAGVYAVSDPVAENGLDVRFVVNVLAPYLLTEQLLPLLGPDGRVVNLSSAAQSPVDLDAMMGKRQLPDQQAYAQSKLALTMWSRHLADRLGANGPMVVSVNPGSLLATNMVRNAYGIAGSDIGIGADILTRAALSDEFADANGKYFDNDSGRFANPHPDALDAGKCERVVRQIETLIAAR